MSDARASSLPRRFYTSVTVAEGEGGHVVLLDGRPVRTPAQKALGLPRRLAAEAVAAEWEAQRDVIDPATMPLTRLVNTTIDGIAEDPGPVREELKRFAETDLLFYRADGPDPLAARQAEGWDPVVAWAETSFGGLFAIGSGVMHRAQPDRTLQAIAGRLDREGDPFVLSALHQMTTLTSSFLLAFAVREGRLSTGDAWTLAHVDEDWNIQHWGYDAEAAARRDRRFAEMVAAACLIGDGPLA